MCAPGGWSVDKKVISGQFSACEPATDNTDTKPRAIKFSVPAAIAAP